MFTSTELEAKGSDYLQGAIKSAGLM